jgi:hypothetical protein
MVENGIKKLPKVAQTFHCKNCDYLTCKKSSYDKHIATDKHKKTENGSKMVENDDKKLLEKVALNFHCETCDYFTSKKSNYDKHILTDKHKTQKVAQKLPKVAQKLPEVAQKLPEVAQNYDFKCDCGKSYKHNSGYYRHKKICNFTALPTEFMNQQLMVEICKDYKDLILEQNKQMIELSKQIVHNTTNNTTNNNTSNNKFNINLFLNEKCKDALNIQDFVSQLDIGINDLEETGRLGFAEGISKIIIKGLNQLEFYERPLHCNDSKREVLYIKNDDKWTKEDSKPILTNAIKQVAHKNMKKISEWQKLNKDYYDPDSKQNDKYLKIVSESMSGSSKEESEKNYDKIIKKLVKETVIPTSEK